TCSGLPKLPDNPNSPCREAKELEESTWSSTVIHKVDTLCAHSPVPVLFGWVIWVIDIHDSLFRTAAAGHSPDLGKQIIVISIVHSQFLVIDELAIGGLLSVASALPRDLDGFFA